MTEPNKNLADSPEVKTHANEKMQEVQKPEQKDINETTSTILVEAGNLVEGIDAEGTGEISESENITKEGDTGGTIAQTQAQTKAASFAGTLPQLPSLVKMTHQIQKEVKSEMKILNKKINKVLKKKNIDANSLNALVARLRELKSILALLASATAEMIKDMWISYVRDKKS